MEKKRFISVLGAGENAGAFSLRSLRHRRKLHLGLFVLALAFSAAGCATKIPAVVKHLPEMDTSSVKKLAVAPFKDSDGSSLQKQLAADLTRKANEVATGTGKFQIVNYGSIQRDFESGKDVSLNVDAVLTGEVISAGSQDSTRQVPVAIMQNGKKVGERMENRYDREVSVSFNFQLLRARDRGPLGSKTKSGKDKQTGAKNPGELQSVQQMASGIIQKETGDMNRYLVPWEETIYLTLKKIQKPAADDKAAKASFKEALGMAKQGSYGAAEKIFTQIYKDKQSRDAGYNAALMMEAQGKIQDAIALMGQLGETAAVSRMMGSVAAAQAVADFEANQDSAINKAIKTVSESVLEGINEAFPDGTKVAIMKSADNTSDAKDLLDYAVDKVTSAFMGSSITVVERSANAAAVKAEQEYQMSGNVRDEDVVSIGNESGAQVIIFMSIRGSANARQLKVEAVNVETMDRIYNERFDI